MIYLGRSGSTAWSPSRNTRITYPTVPGIAATILLATALISSAQTPPGLLSVTKSFTIVNQSSPGPGSVPWSNPGSVLVQDGQFATVVLSMTKATPARLRVGSMVTT